MMLTRPKPEDIADFKSDMNLMQTVYGIMLVLGYRQLGESLYAFLNRSLPVDQAFWSITAGAIALMLVGFRFFWAVGNIRRYVIRSVRRQLPPETIRKRVTTFFFPTLLLHAVGFYILCRLHSELLTPAQFADNALRLVWGFAAFLSLNVAWLLALTVRMPQGDRQPESTWMRSNLSFAVGIVAAYYALLYYAASAQLSFLIVSLVMIGNSLVDLRLAAFNYVSSFEGHYASGGR